MKSSSHIPLRTLALQYLTTPHGHKKQFPGHHVMQKILRMVREVEETLGREATAADLTRETYKQLLIVWMERMPTAHAVDRFAGLFRSFWRFAGDLALSDDAPERKTRGRKRGNKPLPLGTPRGDRPTLSTAEGTLWSLCLKTYFRVNIAIRCEQTRRRYGIALADFREFLGHDPTPSDLTDDNLAGLTGLLLSRENAPETINERTGRIRALWTWMAKRRLVEMFPTVQNVKEPRRTPRAWTQDEIGRLFAACDAERKPVCGIPGSLFWRTLHAVLWDTGERIGALLALRWEWIDLATGRVNIPAEARKGGDQDMAYSLHPETIALLRQIEQPRRELVFPWPGAPQSIYYPYKKILARADLPNNSKSKFHRMRRSVASHLQAAGVDATAALGHSSADLTRRSYLDPAIVGGVAPHSVLFRPAAEKPEKKEKQPPESSDWL